ncbi:MAG: hypothetical protein IAG10_23060 [Planctomycetaceae bacterium]|nr:hypothetical protein [Planctomycetaceae bacterium]
MSQTHRPNKPKHGLFEFLLGGLVCVGVPALMTAMAPVSWLEFTRAGEQVRVTTQTCMFFVIPYRVNELADVKRFETTFHRGDELHKRPGDGKHGRAEDEAGLVLYGPQEGQQVSVPVSPASIKSVETRLKAFLEDPKQQNLSLFTVANWKVGLIFAIPVCLLTVLYVVGWSIWLGQTLAKPFHALRHDESFEPDEAVDERVDP